MKTVTAIQQLHVSIVTEAYPLRRVDASANIEI